MLLATGPFSSTLSILQSWVHKFLSSANMRSKPKGNQGKDLWHHGGSAAKRRTKGYQRYSLPGVKKRSSSGNPALRSGIPLASNSPTARRQHLVIPNYAAVWHPQVACSESLHLACHVPVTSRTSPKHIPWKPERVWLCQAVHGIISEMRKNEDGKTSQKV